MFEIDHLKELKFFHLPVRPLEFILEFCKYFNSVSSYSAKYVGYVFNIQVTCGEKIKTKKKKR